MATEDETSIISEIAEIGTDIAIGGLAGGVPGVVGAAGRFLHRRAQRRAARWFAALCKRMVGHTPEQVRAAVEARFADDHGAGAAVWETVLRLLDIVEDDVVSCLAALVQPYVAAGGKPDGHFRSVARFLSELDAADLRDLRTLLGQLIAALARLPLVQDTPHGAATFDSDAQLHMHRVARKQGPALVVLRLFSQIPGALSGSRLLDYTEDVELAQIDTARRLFHLLKLHGLARDIGSSDSVYASSAGKIGPDALILERDMAERLHALVATDEPP